MYVYNIFYGDACKFIFKWHMTPLRWSVLCIFCEMHDFPCSPWHVIPYEQFTPETQELEWNWFLLGPGIQFEGGSSCIELLVASCVYSKLFPNYSQLLSSFEWQKTRSFNLIRFNPSHHAIIPSCTYRDDLPKLTVGPMQPLAVSANGRVMVFMHP